MFSKTQNDLLWQEFNSDDTLDLKWNPKVKKKYALHSRVHPSAKCSLAVPKKSLMIIMGYLSLIKLLGYQKLVHMYQ